MKHPLNTLLRRELIMYVIGTLMSVVLHAQTNLSATAIASQMTIGWNHGNSLEVPGNETGWGNAPATQQLIDGVTAAGFNTIRLPCAWDSYANQSTYTIDPNWLARVKEVVDYCYANNLYVILNSHWDGGWLEEHPLYANQAEVNAKQQAYWTQIANYFSSYDQHLLFAGTNEVRANYNEPSTENIEVQESYNQTFIDAVRATGGNNLSRILVVQTYNTNAWHGLNYFSTPNDPVSDRLFVEIHHYDPYDFTLNPDNNACQQWDTGNCSWAGSSYVENLFSQIEQRWVNNDIPVIIGEFGAIKRDGIDSSERLEYLEFTVDAAIRHGMIPIYWDNGYVPEFALFDRSNGNTIDQPTVDALMAGVGAVNPPVDYTLTLSSTGSGTVVSNPSGSTHASGTQLTLSANPASGWIFSGWSGDLSGSTNPIVLTIGSNTNAIANFVEAGALGTGTILREYWTNISGTNLSSLTGSANYPNTPSGSEQIASFEAPINWADNYGTRIRGYIHPPTTGTYTFWIAGDDNTDLYLSSDDQVANASRVAYVDGWTNSQQWQKFTTQSATANLIAGQKYYVEVLHKEGTGGDNLAVAWQGPGISQSVINGTYLSPFIDDGSTTQYTLSTVVNGQGFVNPSSGNYSSGTSITVTATPASGWQFDGWSSGSNDNPIAVIMDGNKTVTANFSTIATGTSITIQENTNGFCSVDGTIDSNHINHSGSGFANTYNAAGNGIEYSISAPAGSVTLEIQYANESIDRLARVLVNGSQQVSNLVLASTNSWTSWTSVDTTISLNEGINRIRLEATTDEGLPNVDYIKLSGTGVNTASCTGNARQSSEPSLALMDAMDIKAYPNPFNESFKLRFKDGSFIQKIEIYQLSGQLQEVIDHVESNHTLTLGDKLKSGLYIVRVHKEGNIEDFTILKK